MAAQGEADARSGRLGGLAAAAIAARARPVEEIKDALFADVTAFCRGKFEDDATLIVVGL